jgi:hypothetical protein
MQRNRNSQENEKNKSEHMGLNGKLWDKISAECEILYCKAGKDHIRDMNDRCFWYL